MDNLDCLRHQPFSKLNAIFNTSTASAWQPIVDGDFIARWASIQLAEGDFVKVPVIDGANTDEGTAFGPVRICPCSFLRFLIRSNHRYRSASTARKTLLTLQPAMLKDRTSAHNLLQGC